ncbi:MAG: N-acetylmuramoyl-L-alanine amidase [Bacillota bacterium]|nr:N-acetylmuramoyl-L-alanine amidase [Bacillota bacterium]
MPEGLVADSEQIYKWPHVPGRPIFTVDRSRRAAFTYSLSDVPVDGRLLALEAGPMILEDGRVPDFDSLLRQGQFNDWTATTRTQQVAVGRTNDGTILHVVALALNLLELAAFKRERGCVQAMKLDGGGSTGLMEDGNFALAFRTRRLPNAIVMTQVSGPQTTPLGTTPPGPTPPGPTPSKKRVMLDPSGTSVTGPNGTREGDIALAVCLAARRTLERSGVQCLLTREQAQDEGMTVEERIHRCNSASPACFVTVHCGQSPDPGVRGLDAFHWYRSGDGRRLAESLVERMWQSTGLNKRPLPVLAVHSGETGYFRTLKYTYPPAAMLDAGFLTSPADEALLLQPCNQALAGNALATALLDWL